MKLSELINLLKSEPYNPDAEVNFYYIESGERKALKEEDIDFNFRDCVEFNVEL